MDLKWAHFCAGDDMEASLQDYKNQLAVVLTLRRLADICLFHAFLCLVVCEFTVCLHV